MGEEACYLRLVDDSGRVREGPVVTWSLDSGLAPPPGRAQRVDPAGTSPERRQFLLNLAREDRLVLLYEPGQEAEAEALAADLLDRLKKK